MNKLTLQFQSKELEDKYSKYVEKVYIPKLNIFLNYALFVLVIPCVIMNLFQRQKAGAILYILAGITIKYRQFFNIYLLFIEVGAQLLQGSRLYANGPTLNTQDAYVLFFFGASMMQIQFIMHNICQTLLHPILTTISQLIIFITLTWDYQMYDYKFSYILFTLCTTYFLHHNLKEKKEIFMFKEQQKQWIKILKNGISQKIITIQYNQKENELKLNIINKNAQQKFKISNELDFKNFSRRVNLFRNEVDAFEDYDKFQTKADSKNQQINSLKNSSLESIIIQFMKYNFNNKNRKDSIKPNKKYDTEQKNKIEKQFTHLSKKSIQSPSQQPKLDFLKQTQYFAIIQSDQNQAEMYKIKMSYFLNEGYHQCYILFDQKSDEEIIKSVIDSKKKLEQRFISNCQQLGQNIESNVLKISISDKSGGIDLENLLQILREISCQKYKYNLDQLVYSNLGWKINMFNIGQIGPYSNFFISPQTFEGIKVCFYIFSDVNIVLQPNDKIAFTNQDFLDDHKRLMETYYHKDSIQIIKSSTISLQDLNQFEENVKIFVK